MHFTARAWPPPPAAFVSVSIFDFPARLPRVAVLFAPALLLVSLIVIRHRSLATSNVTADNHARTERPHINLRSLHEIYFLKIL
jgi:hypothetical protein